MSEAAVSAGPDRGCGDRGARACSRSMPAERDEFATCPRCQAALDPRGDRWICSQCTGLLLPEPALSQMIAEMIGSTVSALGWRGKVAEPQPLVLTPREATEHLTCPRCTTQMEATNLYGIEVDRCPAHGLWFDRDELEKALQRGLEAGRTKTPAAEKVFAGALMTAYIAAWVLRFLAL